MFVCMHVCVCIMCVYVEAHVQCHPQFLSTLLFEIESLPKPGAHQLGRLAGVKLQALSVCSFPVLGLQVCVCADGLT